MGTLWVRNRLGGMRGSFWRFPNHPALREIPPTAVTLPWAKPDGERKTFRLLFVDAKARAYNRSVFNMGDWKRALRHAYASVLLDAGESIKALSEYLGHSDLNVPWPPDGPSPAPKRARPEDPARNQ